MSKTSLTKTQKNIQLLLEKLKGNQEPKEIGKLQNLSVPQNIILSTLFCASYKGSINYLPNMPFSEAV